MSIKFFFFSTRKVSRYPCLYVYLDVKSPLDWFSYDYSIIVGDVWFLQ